MLATPKAVLINVGQSEHKVTVIADTRKDFAKNPSLAYVADTIMVTIGNQASGETGLKIWISGFNAAFAVALRPAMMPNGIATTEAIKKPKKTVWMLVQIWS